MTGPVHPQTGGPSPEENRPAPFDDEITTEISRNRKDYATYHLFEHEVDTTVPRGYREIPNSVFMQDERDRYVLHPAWRAYVQWMTEVSSMPGFRWDQTPLSDPQSPEAGG